MKEISLNILDIAENSVRAGCSEVSITIRESVKRNLVELTIEDDGPGMAPGIIDKVSDPFFTTRGTRRVGLGIPLLKMHAEATGGRFCIYSGKGRGTCVKAVFIRDHIDRQPLGDIAGILKVLCRINEINFSFAYHTDEGEFHLSGKDIKSGLNVKSLNDQGLIRLIGEFIENNLEAISAEGYIVPAKVDKLEG